MEALNHVICQENYRQTSGIAARFRQRVGRVLDPPLPLFEVGNALPDDDNEDELEGSENNMPPQKRQNADRIELLDRSFKPKTQLATKIRA